MLSWIESPGLVWQPVLELNVVWITKGHVPVSGVIGFDALRFDACCNQPVRQGLQGYLAGGGEGQVVETDPKLVEAIVGKRMGVISFTCPHSRCACQRWQWRAPR